MNLLVAVIKKAFLVFREFLEFRDLIQLYKVSSTVNNEILIALEGRALKLTLVDRLKNNLYKSMKEFGLNATDFFSILVNIGGVVAGGFALSVFNDELFGKSDIDVYVPYDETETIEIKLETSGFGLYLIQQGYKKSCTHQGDGYPIGYVAYYHKFYVKYIQIMVRKTQRIDGETFGDSVVRHFDFTPVMNYIEISHNHKLKFCAHFVQDILYLNLKINPQYDAYMDLFRSLERLLKYSYRGFMIHSSVFDMMPECVRVFISLDRAYKVERTLQRLDRQLMRMADKR